MPTPEAKNARDVAAHIVAKHNQPRKLPPPPTENYFFVRDTENGKLYAENQKWTTDKTRAAKYSPRSYAEEIAGHFPAMTLEIIEVDKA